MDPAAGAETTNANDQTSLARAVNDNWAESWAALIGAIGGEVRHFGKVQAFRTPGAPVTFANGTLVTERTAPDDLVAAIEWVRQNEMPFGIRLTVNLEQELAPLATAAGLVRGNWPFPGMILTPIPAAPLAPAAIRTARVDAANRRVFIDALVDQGMNAEFADAAFGPDTLANPNIGLFVAWLADDVAGNSLLYRTLDVGGIYAVGTVERARRRGVGTAVTWAAVQQARDWGCWAVTLQATQMGLPVYRAMGFQTVVEYITYLPPGVGDEG